MEKISSNCRFQILSFDYFENNCSFISYLPTTNLNYSNEFIGDEALQPADQAITMRVF